MSISDSTFLCSLTAHQLEPAHAQQYLVPLLTLSPPQSSGPYLSRGSQLYLCLEPVFQKQTPATMYRLINRYLVESLIKTWICPPFLLSLLVEYFDLNVSIPALVLLHMLTIPSLYILRTHISVYRSDRAAHRLGAKPIPRVKGKLPLNVDVVLDWAKSGSEEEVGRMMVLLGRKYGKTYNTRALGEDQVSIDEKVAEGIDYND
jgi:hypothetical protein